MRLTLFKFVSSVCVIAYCSCTIVFAQSAEQGQVFNKYSTGAEEGVDLFSGTSSLNRKLVTISSGNASAAVELNYFGNVSEVVQNKNDIAPTSWVGLGWSLGHAKIVSENSGTMWIGDDSFFLVTSSGVKYKIFKSGKNKNNSDKWWIESLPYWTVKPEISRIQFENNSYDIVVGWSICDDAGNKYYYGDGAYRNGDDSPIKRNATEYTLANPYSTGVVGVIDNGKDELFPKAWNLRKIEDYDGNYLEYEYEQFLEKVRKRVMKNGNMESPLDSLMKNSYTKECYLKSIKSSQGESIVFETKQKDYVNEFLDYKGNLEKDETNPDAYIDPIERRYLSKIEVLKKITDKEGNDKQVTIKNIDFCYKPLNVEFNKEKKSGEKNVVDDNSEYVKRLLTAVVESSSEGEIIQKELYSYYENDFDADSRLPLNIGALRSVKSNNCGTVEYIYKEQNLVEQNDKSGIHYDVLPLVEIAMGNLEDGTTYLVGKNVEKEVIQVYHRINGSWKLIQNLEKDLFTHYKNEFIIGDRNWFIHVKKKDNYDDVIYLPYEWNGKSWENKKEIKDSGDADFVEPGPGYILKANVKDKTITLTMPWNIWNGGSDELILDRNADSDDDDRKYTALFTSKNHFGIFFKDRSAFNSGHLKIWSFRSDKSIGPETFDDPDLDDDNHYAFIDDNILVAGTESKHISGHYAEAYHFYENDKKEPSWYKHEIREFDDGWITKGFVDIMAMGDGYVAFRHDDNDDLSLFEFDGDKWSVVPGVDEKNMVNQNYDPKTEAEWDAFNGYNFFVVRMPYIERHWYYNYIRPQRNYGIYYKEKKEWKWKYIYNAGSKNVNKTVIFAGSNWFITRVMDVPFVLDVKINNGKEWKDDVNWKNFPFIWKDYEGNYANLYVNERSLNGDFLVLEKGADSWILYKKRDSFTSGIGAFVVKEKIVDDPITSKKITYTYDFHMGKSAYDYVTKAPIVNGVSIYLPDNTSRIIKSFCVGDGEMAGIAKGQVCSESYCRNDVNGCAKALNKTIKKYSRYRGENDSWPGYVYIDRLTSVEYTNRNIRTMESYVYADGLNDLVKSVTVKNQNTGENISESVNVFAAEIESYKAELKKDNRLIEKAAVYQCVPDCKNGKIVSGVANKYEKYDGKLRVSEEWAYTPKKSRDSRFMFDWNSSKFDSWQNTKKYSHFKHGIPSQTEYQLGLKSSILFDKGESKKILASLKNAGIDEILLMPGDTCGIENWDEEKCKVIPLVGHSIEKANPNECDVDYGRFTDNAVYVSNENDLSGKVLHAKKSKYRFSAWVQGTDYSNASKELFLKVDGMKVSFPLKGKGQWEYIEWTSDKVYGENAEISVSLSTPDASKIHLQDIRFVPVDAIVNVNFYEKKWNKPIASVNDRGVGSYYVYDSQGRVVQTYGENAKHEVYLTSKNAYQLAVCSVSGTNKSLKNLVVNGIEIPIKKSSGVIEMTVDNNTDEIDVSWETALEGENVYYRTYQTGASSVPDYKGIGCCSSTKKIVQKFKGQSMTLDIAVSTIDSPYSVVLNKSTTGWVDYGANLGNGSGPIYCSKNDISGIFYLNNGDLNRANYEISEWKKHSESQSTAIDYVGSTLNNGSSYVFALPDVDAGNYNTEYIEKNGLNAKGLFASLSSLQQNTEKELVKMDDFEGASTKSRYYRIASNKDNTESYVVYEKTVSTKTDDDVVVGVRYPKGDSLNPVEKKKKLVKKDVSLVGKKLQNNKWVDCGTISNTGVNDVSLAIGAQNIPYVAYIGTSASKKQKKILVEDPNGLYENIDLSEIPDEYKMEYDSEELYVVVKHLEKIGGLNKWVGYDSVDGDILQINGQDLLGAKKIKMASDGQNVYIALLYDEFQNNSKYALKVFRLKKESDKLKFVEIVDSFAGSSTIAYLEVTNHFDIEVNGGVPYVAFENEDNDRYVSVLKFESNRWKSVGRPAFAKISSEKNSLDLALANNIPYVVFKESEESLNNMRQGKVVPMKYSINDDKDLTISSIGNKEDNALFGIFRPYILNYQYDVSKNTEKMTFNVKFSNVNHIRAFIVMNNGENAFNWVKNAGFSGHVWFDGGKNGNLSSITVLLKNGKNKIKMLVWGENGNTLTYNFVIRRDYIDGIALNIQDQNGNKAFTVYGSDDGVPVTSPSAEYDNSSSSTVVVPDNTTYGIVPPEDGSSTKSICIDHSSAWRMIVNGCYFSMNDCFDYDFVNRTFIVPVDKCEKSNESFVSSSSSLLSSSSTNSSQIVFVDQEGNEQIVDIVVLDGQKPTMSKSSSSMSGFGMSSSSILSNHSSSSNYNSYISSSSMLFDISSSSISENSSSSITDNSSSSSIEIDNKDNYGKVVHETAIPESFANLVDYKFVGGERISIANSVNVNGGKFIAGAIDVAAGAQINGTLMSYGNVFVGSGAYVNTFVVGGDKDIQHGAVITNYIEKAVDVPSVPLVSFSYGLVNVNVLSNNSAVLQPGAYQSINVYSNASVNFEPGVYYVKSLYIAPDVSVNLRTDVDLVQIWIEDDFSIGDRSTFHSRGGASKCFVYGNSVENMYVGTNVNLEANVAYPNGSVNLAPNSTLSGAVWAKSITVGAKASIR